MTEQKNVLVVRIKRLAVDGKATEHAVTAIRMNGERVALSSLEKACDLVSSSKESWTLVAVIPARRCIYSQIERPKSSARQLRKMLPYLLEENLSTDVEKLHIVHPTVQGEILELIAIETTALQNVVNHIRTSLNAEPDFLVADAHILDHSSHECLLVQDSTHALIVHATGRYETDGELAPMFLQRLNSDNVEPAISHINCSDSPAATIQGIDSAELSPQVGHSTFSSLDDYLVEQVLNSGRLQSVNLLQGRFAPYTSRSLADRLRPIAAILFIALSSYLLILNYCISTISESILEHKGAHEAQYKLYFPETQRVVDPVRQLRIYLNKPIPVEKSRISPLELLSDAMSHVFDGNNDTHTIVESLRIPTDANFIEMTLSTRRFASLEAVREKLTHRGYKTTISGAQETDKGINATIKIVSPYQWGASSESVNSA